MAYKIAIDPGHGGLVTKNGVKPDSGAIFSDYFGSGKHLYERHLTEGISRYLNDILKSDNNFTPYLTREIYTTTENPGDAKVRGNLINNFGAQLSISIHSNSSTSGGKGFEVYPKMPNQSFHEESLKFGKLLVKHVGGLNKFPPRGIDGVRYRSYSTGAFFESNFTNPNGAETDYFGLIRVPNCPAVLAETCFTNVREDISQFDSEAKWKVAAFAYYQAICEYFGLSPTVKSTKDYIIGCNGISGGSSSGSGGTTQPLDGEKAEIYSDIVTSKNIGIAPSGFLSTSSPAVMNLYAGNTTSGTKICLWKEDHSNDQGFQIIKQSNGSYKIASAHNNSKFLKFSSASVGSTASIS